MKEEFYSERTQKPFNECSVCDEPLGSSLYFIEKVFVKNPEIQKHFVLFEYAICSKCREEMMEEVSEESKLAIKNFMEAQEEQFSMNELNNIEGLDHCAFTHEPIDNMDEYNMIGIFQNGIEVIPPFVISGRIKESYQEILSEKTKGFFDDFFNDFIDIPPALAKILDKDIKPVVF